MSTRRAAKLESLFPSISREPFWGRTCDLTATTNDVRPSGERPLGSAYCDPGFIGYRYLL